MTTNELWEFIPSDDELETSPEEDAMSILDPVEQATGLSDPGRREVDVGEPDSGPPLALFADEDGAPARRVDHEVDLAEILEAQHYVLGVAETPRERSTEE